MSDPGSTWPDEPELYERMVAKDWPAWEAAFWKLYPWMIGLVWARTRDWSDADAAEAENVALDLLGRWRRVMDCFAPKEGVPPAQRLQTYLKTIVRNAFISWFRKRRRRLQTAAVSLDELPVTPEALTHLEGFDALALYLALQALPDDERRLIEMKFWEELTFAEIAQRLKVSVATAYRMVLQTVQKLQRALS
jgi:RNA polymerase sigma factor (sigma-70 family)